VLASIASVQFGSALARTLFDDVGAAGATLLRIGLAAVVLLVVVRPPLRTWSRPQWAAAALLGLAVGCMNLVFYQAIRYVPLGIAVTVEFTGPLLLALVQTRRRRDASWALLAAAGVLLLGLGPTDGVPLRGLALAFAAGLFWAAYIVASARVGRVLPGLDGLPVAMAIGALPALLLGSGVIGAVAADPALLLPGLALAVLSSILPYGLELVALRHIPTRVFGVLMSLEPAAAALAGFVVLGQGLGPVEVAALVMVSVASAGVTLGRRAEDEPGPGPAALGPA
jgi:inner membrane transporter RhtA